MIMPPSSLEFAKDLANRVSRYRPTSKAVQNAMTALEIRRRRRRELPRKSNGYEYVVENLLRPVITKWTVVALGIRPEDAPRRVNSSHYHSTDDPQWPEEWTEFKRLHPHVDIDDSDGHGRRADLFVAMDDGALVSLDFKYVHPHRTPGVAICATQLSLCLEQHEATILVIYAGHEPSKRLDATATELRTQLNSERAFVVTIGGPAIEF